MNKAKITSGLQYLLVQLFGNKKKRGSGARAKSSCLMLNNISAFFFFFGKIAIFDTLKKITHLDFRSNLKRKYPKC